MIPVLLVLLLSLSAVASKGAPAQTSTNNEVRANQHLAQPNQATINSQPQSNQQVSAFNNRSEKIIDKVGEKAVNHADVLESCSETLCPSSTPTPKPTTTPTPQPNPSPTSDPSPSPDPLPSPDPSPEPEPTPIPLPSIIIKPPQCPPWQIVSEGKDRTRDIVCLD